MEPLNSGDRLEIWNPAEGWIRFREAYLIEAAEYKLRYFGKYPDVRFQGISIPFYREQDCFICEWMTPFQSGLMTVSINQQQYETYIYPDHRKLTEDQYHTMLKEIIEEASVCFEYSGLEMKIDAFGKGRDISWPQWSFIIQNFSQLRQIYTKIQRQPLKLLENRPIMMKREKVQQGANDTLRWLDKRGYGYDIPKNVQSVKTFETNNIYENQVLKQQLMDLCRLLQLYMESGINEVSSKAKQFERIIRSWLNHPFLADVSKNKGSYRITQRFRKHPVYRGWYQWFDKLYNHKEEGIGFSYPVPLKDTFQLYEIWCYMMIVKTLRKLGHVHSTRELFKIERSGIFLDLTENKESCITLNNGTLLCYQRNYQYNSKRFYTYTQRMIPDIVLEGKNSVVIFDPKYRVPNNLGTALGEMHKYKDGIIHRDSGKRAVKEVFILTPTKSEDTETLRYFDKEYHEDYGMGAMQLVPGENVDRLKGKLLDCVERFE